jgi:hypothetical protein
MAISLSVAEARAFKHTKCTTHQLALKRVYHNSLLYFFRTDNSLVPLLDV